MSRSSKHQSKQDKSKQNESTSLSFQRGQSKARSFLKSTIYNKKLRCYDDITLNLYEYNLNELEGCIIEIIKSVCEDAQYLKRICFETGYGKHAKKGVDIRKKVTKILSRSDTDLSNPNSAYLGYACDRSGAPGTFKVLTDFSNRIVIFPKRFQDVEASINAKLAQDEAEVAAKQEKWENSKQKRKEDKYNKLRLIKASKGQGSGKYKYSKKQKYQEMRTREQAKQEAKYNAKHGIDTSAGDAAARNEQIVVDNGLLAGDRVLGLDTKDFDTGLAREREAHKLSKMRALGMDDNLNDSSVDDGVELFRNLASRNIKYDEDAIDPNASNSNITTKSKNSKNSNNAAKGGKRANGDESKSGINGNGRDRRDRIEFATEEEQLGRLAELSLGRGKARDDKKLYKGHRNFKYEYNEPKDVVEHDFTTLQAKERRELKKYEKRMKRMKKGKSNGKNGSASPPEPGDARDTVVAANEEMEPNVGRTDQIRQNGNYAQNVGNTQNRGVGRDESKFASGWTDNMAPGFDAFDGNERNHENGSNRMHRNGMYSNGVNAMHAMDAMEEKEDAGPKNEMAEVLDGINRNDFGSEQEFEEFKRAIMASMQTVKTEQKRIEELNKKPKNWNDKRQLKYLNPYSPHYNQGMKDERQKMSQRRAQQQQQQGMYPSESQSLRKDNGSISVNTLFDNNYDFYEPGATQPSRPQKNGMNRNNNNNNNGKNGKQGKPGNAGNHVVARVIEHQKQSGSTSLNGLIAANIAAKNSRERTDPNYLHKRAMLTEEGQIATINRQWQAEQWRSHLNKHMPQQNDKKKQPKAKKGKNGKNKKQGMKVDNSNAGVNIGRPEDQLWSKNGKDGKQKNVNGDDVVVHEKSKRRRKKAKQNNIDDINKNFLDQLVMMGYARNDAVDALRKTENKNLNQALDHLMRA